MGRLLMFKEILVEKSDTDTKLDALNKILNAIDDAKKIITDSKQTRKLDKSSDLVEELLYYYGEK